MKKDLQFKMHHFDQKVGEKKEQRKKYWKMRDGTRIEWKDMDNKHVINTYNLINRQLEGFVIDSIQKRIEYNFMFNAKKQLMKQIKERNL